MPKKLTRIIVYKTWGDQHGDYNEHIWSDEAGKFIWQQNNNYDQTTEFQKAGFTRGLVESDYSPIHIEITKALSNEDVNAVKIILSRYFIYPGIISHSYPTSDCSKGEWSDYGYEEHYTRPVIEALFLDKPDIFLDVIKTLCQLDKDELYQAFIDCMAGTDLTPGILFSWDMARRDMIGHEIDELAAYGKKLAIHDDELTKSKGNTAISLAGSLKARFDQAPASAATTLKGKFANLMFKLEFLQELHGEDAEFAIHRGYKRCATNIASFVFSLGLANLAYRIGTGFSREGEGEWLFFNKTATEEKIASMQAKLGFNPEVSVALKK